MNNPRKARFRQRGILIFFLMLITTFTLTSCSLPLEWMPNWMYRSEVMKEPLNKIQGREYKAPVENFVVKLLELFRIGSPKDNSGLGIPEDENPTGTLIEPVFPSAERVDPATDLPLKPVGFVNYGTINAKVQPWSYVALGSNQPQTPPNASTVSTAQGSSGDWPNSSRFMSLPLGTYTWCIEWEEDDQDGDGYFDIYHYIEESPTVLDENDSDDLAFAEEVAISAPPAEAPIYDGKCGETQASDTAATYIGTIENVQFTLIIDFKTGKVSGAIHFDDAEIYGEEGWYWGDAVIDGNIDLVSYAVLADWTGDCGSRYHGISEPWSGRIEGSISDDMKLFSGAYFDDDGTTISFEATRQ